MRRVGAPVISILPIAYVFFLDLSVRVETMLEMFLLACLEGSCQITK